MLNNLSSLRDGFCQGLHHTAKKPKKCPLSRLTGKDKEGAIWAAEVFRSHKSNTAMV